MTEPTLIEYEPGTPFPGKIGKTIDDSTEAWPKLPTAPGRAPNVLFYVLDDTGYGQLSPYGGLIPVPNLERVVGAGVMYTNFYTTAICTATRSCIITGRNHHSNALGPIAEWTTGYPGYNGMTPIENGFISEILLENGYNTYALGKWHLAQPSTEHAAGPYTQWPLGRGFERYYGFLAGEANQWYPDLIYDNHPHTQPASPEDGYHLCKDLADMAIQFIGDAKNISPSKPFFMYYCPGTGHGPHHIWPEWVDRFKGQFDMGWDEYREIVFANQKKLGMFPPDTLLPARDPDVPPWDSLSDGEKKLYARMMEVYAGFQSYQDEQWGRILDYLEDMGELDNTLIMFISDNGASPEGGATGAVNEFNFMNLKPEDLEFNLSKLDELGMPTTYPLDAWGWAQAGNTPFRRWKKETYRGGSSDPFIISWPARFDVGGEMRHQFGHAIDMVPTMLDLVGIEPPDTIRGVEQAPLEGVSLASTIDDADAPEVHAVQYFEMLGCRSIHKDGWRAECGWPGPDFTTAIESGRHPGDAIHAADLEALEKTWQLYSLDEDPTEVNDLAAERPDKLKELIDAWWEEADKYDVLPLQGTWAQRFVFPRPMPGDSSTRFIYSGGAVIPPLVQPHVNNRSHTIEAHVTIPEGGAEGVIYASGAVTGGYSLFVKDKKLHFTYNYLTQKYFRIVADDELPEGDVTILYEFEVTGKGDIPHGEGTPGTGTLFVDGRKVGSVDMDVTQPALFAVEGLSISHDYGDSVDHASYKPPFPFTGTVEKVIYDLSGDAIKNVEAENRRAMTQQ